MSNRANKALIAIECKFNINLDDLTTTSLGKNFEMFRALYPDGDKFVIASNIDVFFKKKYKNLVISFVSMSDLIKTLKIVRS